MFSQSYAPFGGSITTTTVANSAISSSNTPSSPDQKKQRRLLTSSRRPNNNMRKTRRTQSSRRLLPSESRNHNNSHYIIETVEGETGQEDKKEIWEELRRSLQDLNDADFYDNDRQKQHERSMSCPYECLPRRGNGSEDGFDRQPYFVDPDLHDLLLGASTSHPPPSSTSRCFPPRTIVLKPNGQFYTMVPPPPPPPLVRGRHDHTRESPKTTILSRGEISTKENEDNKEFEERRTSQECQSKASSKSNYLENVEEEYEEDDLSMAPPHIIAVQDYDDCEENNEEEDSILSELTSLWKNTDSARSLLVADNEEERTIERDYSFETC